MTRETSWHPATRLNAEERIQTHGLVMIKFRIVAVCFYLAILIFNTTGCERTQTTSTSIDRSSELQLPNPENNQQCTFQEFELFRNNIQNGPTDGCITTFSIDDARAEALSARCGMNAQSVSTVTWEYVKHQKKECTFLFSYNRPTGAEKDSKQTKTIVFRGDPVVVFENELSRTTLRLAPNRR